MATCISHRAGEKYIDLLRKKGISVVGDYEILFTGPLGKRQILCHAGEMLKGLKKYRNSSPPYFYLFTLKLSIKGRLEPHAVTVSVEPDTETDSCTIYLFDPNGKLPCGGKAPIQKGDDYFRQTYTFCQIIFAFAREIKEADLYRCNEDVGWKDVMDGKSPINIAGQGNCNALSLWYITQVAHYGREQAGEHLDDFINALYTAPSGKYSTEKERSRAVNKKRERITEEINQQIIKRQLTI